MTLREATNALYEHLGLPAHPHFVQSIGERAIGQYNDVDEIVVMLNRKPYHFEKQVPTIWHGFPVKKLVVGEIKVKF